MSVKTPAIALAALVALAGCEKRDTARNVLAAQGYTEIEMTGYKLFGCTKGDDFRSGFSALSPSGMRVEGVVCGGVFKGETVRITRTKEPSQ